jgi:hypothetical protein
MPKRTNKFQKLITAIHACIANNGSVEESAFLVDKESGENREVDILIKSLIADCPIAISVEVIDRIRKAGSDWVEEMAAKHQALLMDKLVLVSRSGFTKPALAKAKFKGIDTLTIEEACDTDWKMALRFVGKAVVELFNIRSNSSAHIAGNSDWVPAPPSARVFLPDGEQATVADIVAFALSNQTAKQAVLAHFYSTREQEYHAVYDPPEGTLIEEASNKNSSLVKLSISLHLDFEATPIEFASGRFREREILYAQATEPDNYLCIVMTKKENGEVEGMLYDSNGFRKLIMEN